MTNREREADTENVNRKKAVEVTCGSIIAVKGALETSKDGLRRRNGYTNALAFSGGGVLARNRLAYGAPIRGVEMRLEVGRVTRGAAFGDLLSCSRDIEMDGGRNDGKKTPY